MIYSKSKTYQRKLGTRRLEDDYESSSFFDKHVPIVGKHNGKGIDYQVFITKEIGAPQLYDELVHLLINEVTEDDTVTFHMCTPGGYVDSAMRILDAMAQCIVPVTVTLSGQTSSAGTIITMGAGTVVAGAYASMMIHQFRTGYWGASHEVEKDFEFNQPHIKKFMRDMYEGFLTSEELDNIFKGQDMYLNADEIISRWNQVVDLRQSMIKQEELNELASEAPVYIEALETLGYKVIAPTVEVDEPKKPRTKKS